MVVVGVDCLVGLVWCESREFADLAQKPWKDGKATKIRVLVLVLFSTLRSWVIVAARAVTYGR